MFPPSAFHFQKDATARHHRERTTRSRRAGRVITMSAMLRFLRGKRPSHIPRALTALQTAGDRDQTSSAADTSNTGKCPLIFARGGMPENEPALTPRPPRPSSRRHRPSRAPLIHRRECPSPISATWSP